MEIFISLIAFPKGFISWSSRTASNFHEIHLRLRQLAFIICVVNFVFLLLIKVYQYIMIIKEDIPENKRWTYIHAFKILACKFTYFKLLFQIYQMKNCEINYRCSSLVMYGLSSVRHMKQRENLKLVLTAVSALCVPCCKPIEYLCSIISSSEHF